MIISSSPLNTWTIFNENEPEHRPFTVAKANPIFAWYDKTTFYEWACLPIILSVQFAETVIWNKIHSNELKNSECTENWVSWIIIRLFESGCATPNPTIHPVSREVEIDDTRVDYAEADCELGFR